MHAGIGSGKMWMLKWHQNIAATLAQEVGGERQPPSLQEIYELGVVAVYDDVFSSVLNSDFIFFSLKTLRCFKHKSQMIK